MNKNKEEMKIDKLEFNTYCIFTEEKQSLKETVGLVFKDYIASVYIAKRRRLNAKLQSTEYI